MPSFHDDVIAIVARIPRGRVTTYGRIARMTPVPSGARGVGWALAALPGAPIDEVPWWRVINASGRISNVDNADEQRRLLKAEGIAVSDEGRIDLGRYLWDESDLGD